MDHTLEGYKNVTKLFNSRGQLERVETYARGALDRLPRRPVVLTFVAKALTSRQKYREASSLLAEALTAEPDYAEARSALARVQLETGSIQEAVDNLTEAMELDRTCQEAYAMAGGVYIQLGRMDEAVAHLTHAVELLPDDVMATAQLAEALCLIGRAAEGVAYYQRALRIRRNMPPVAAKLAWVLATSDDLSVRDGRQAVALAERAATMSGGRPEVLVSLAAAYAADGQFERAIGVATQAHAGARQAGDAELARRASDHLRVYRGYRGLVLGRYDRIEGW